MLTPALIQTLTHFYPFGNTPAISLTQYIAPDQDASLLLLGCGDSRNVLFTVYSESENYGRRLDITCCDVEAEILARNIILYTLFLDDTDGASTVCIWNIYYHMKLDAKSLDLLREQADKLQNTSRSIEDWRKGPYGDIIRFCDIITFNRVADMWKFYAIRPSHGKRFKVQQKQLKAGFLTARNNRKERIGTNSNEGAVYWETGLVMGDRQTRAAAAHPNPMLGVSNRELTLHYALNPLLGFHQESSRNALAQHSPLQPGPGVEKLSPECAAALTEFAAWGASFRFNRKRICLRFVAADALALCHVLQHHRAHKNALPASWYRDRRQYQTLDLDSDEYSQDEPAPTAFNIIDTSNLGDHLKLLNIFTACVPLSKPDAVVHTETLGSSSNTNDRLEEDLHGDIPTVAALFSLQPIQFWTNTVPFPTNDSRRQDRTIWRRAMHRIGFDHEELAMLIYSIYVQMFKDESWALRFRDPLGVLVGPNMHYSRAGIAALLRLLKNNEIVDWDRFICTFQDYVLADPLLNMGRHYLQELFLHLDNFGLLPNSAHVPDLTTLQRSLLEGPLRNWRDIPSTLCLTLVVPRDKLAFFRNTAANQTGTPVCHIMMQCPRGSWQNIFSDIQLGFGDIRTSGQKASDDFIIAVTPDDKRWEGNTSLIVSTLVPTWMVLDDPTLSTEVIFALKSTPASVRFTQQFGMFLEIHTTTLAANDVLISRHRPNTEGSMSVSCASIPRGQLPSTLHTLNTNAASIALRASIGEEGAIGSVTVGIDFRSEEALQLFKSSKNVSVKQPSPFSLCVDFGIESCLPLIDLPVPLNMIGGMTKIMKKKGRVEFSAPVESRKATSMRPEYMFPMATHNGFSELKNLPYISLDRLPSVSLKKPSNLGWILDILPLMYSEKERCLHHIGVAVPVWQNDAHARFKNSLSRMFSHVAGIDGKQQCFDFQVRTHDDNIHMLIAVSALRLDLANQSIVLDAAVYLCTRSQLQEESLKPFAGDVATMIVVSADELVLWKKATRAFVERCRDRAHLPSCEYKFGMSDPEQLLCSCGRGEFPADYETRKVKDKDILKHCVRAAIAPYFPVSDMHRTLNSEFSSQFSGSQTFRDSYVDRNSPGETCAVS
ncbi:hypothetical protein P171DRAFT_512676 [Karstenula rhodostoma CBS 690.94]|uniref:DUF4470 domain-containing protein n=1 Tax=Karstenula rhodostoma CBS 690.94 TaxID=1392251 RepID=A0A9P4PK16_9PLEO|nr:hypothetical protein P171DRAFT_512676 [Karstenula rhodostoma CBS 690.94]